MYQARIPWWLHGTFNGETGESRGLEISGEWQATREPLFRRQRVFREIRVHRRYATNADLARVAGGRAGNAESPEGEILGWRSSTPCLRSSGGDLWFRYDTSYQGESWVNLNAAIDKDPEGFVPSWKSSNLQVGLTFETAGTLP